MSIPFCGFDPCSVDSNGRLKLSPRVLDDFARFGGEFVLRCLPEGAVGVYPEEVFLKMRRADSAEKISEAASSSLARRNLRLLNALSQPGKISPQGRITIPEMFRAHAGLDAAPEAVVVGVDIGIEIWSLTRWNEERKRIAGHMEERDALEMRADLDAFGNPQRGAEK